MSAAAWFFVSGAVWIDVPGLYVDEVLFSNALYPDTPEGPTFSVLVFGRNVPLMSFPYIGALKGWLWTPIVSLWGASPATARLPALALGAATVFLAGLVTERLFGWKAAAAAAFLAATDPAFLLTTRMDWGPAAIQRLLVLWAVWLSLRFWDSRRLRSLFFAAFLLGLGLFAKLTFAWLLTALAGATLLIAGRALAEVVSLRTSALFLAGLLLGSAPYWVYRLSSPPQAPSLVLETEPQRYLEKWWMLRKTLGGDVARNWMFETSAESSPRHEGMTALFLESTEAAPFSARFQETLAVPALALALVALPWTLRSPSGRGLLFVLSYSALALVQMAPVRDAGSVHHLVLIHPFPSIFIGASLAAIGGRLRVESVRLAAGSAAVALLLYSNVICLARQYSEGLRFGGTVYWSEALYRLHARLETQPDSHAVLLNWGLYSPLRFLSEGRKNIWPTPLPWDWNEGAVSVVERRLEDPETLWVAYADESRHMFPQNFERVRTAAERAGMVFVLDEQIRDRQGRAIYSLYRAHRESGQRR